MSTKKRKAELPVLTPPSSHVAVDDFLKELRVKGRAARAEALEQLAIAADGSAFGINNSDCSGDDFSDSESSDEDGDLSELSCRLAGSRMVFIAHDAEGNLAADTGRRHSRKLLASLCNMLATESGSVEKGLDAVSAILLSQSALQAIAPASVDQFLSGKASKGDLGEASAEQWSDAIRNLCGHFCYMSRDVLLFRTAGSVKRHTVRVYPQWLLEALFTVMDRQYVKRLLVIP